MDAVRIVKTGVLALSRRIWRTDTRLGVSLRESGRRLARLLPAKRHRA